MAVNQYAVVTPYCMPAALLGKKAINLGDGIILQAIERLLGKFPEYATFSSRVGIASDNRNLLSEVQGVVLAGANQLHNEFTPWPGLSAADLRRSGARLIPFGIGVYGSPERLCSLTQNARELLEVIHERIEFSSWRCPLSIAFLEREMPQLRGRFLMTGCPVAYDSPVLEGKRFHDGDGRIAVTVTDREDFWDREVRVLDFVAARFRWAQRFLVLHQDFVAMAKTHQGEIDPRGPQALRQHAARLGYEIVVPKSVDEAYALYESIDFHVGSRVHAHLLFLSRNKRSCLFAIDDRARGLASAFGFRLSTIATIDQDISEDFEVVREAIRASYGTMLKFTSSLQRTI